MVFVSGPSSATDTEDDHDDARETTSSVHGPEARPTPRRALPQWLAGPDWTR